MSASIPLCKGQLWKFHVPISGSWGEDVEYFLVIDVCVKPYPQREGFFEDATVLFNNGDVEEQWDHTLINRVAELIEAP